MTLIHYFRSSLFFLSRLILFKMTGQGKVWVRSDMTINWFHIKTNFDQLVMAAGSSGLNEVLRRTRLSSLGDSAGIDLWCLSCTSVGGWERFTKVPWLLFLSPQLIARWRLFFSLSPAFLSKKKKKEERKRKHTRMWKAKHFPGIPSRLLCISHWPDLYNMGTPPWMAVWKSKHSDWVHFCPSKQTRILLVEK